MRSIYKHGIIMSGFRIFMLFVVVLLFISCSDESDKYAIKRQNEILDRMNRQEKLSMNEINNLTAIYIRRDKYNEGISELEKLIKKASVYKNELYGIYFNLSLLYGEKAKQTKSKQLITKTEEYLKKGFESVSGEPVIFYKRAKIFAVMGCINNAKEDMLEAINNASSKDVVFFEDDIFISSEKFIELLQNDLLELNKRKNNCLFDNY